MDFDWVPGRGIAGAWPKGQGEGAKRPEVAQWITQPRTWHRGSREAVMKHQALPGHTAAFVNYTSFSRGINGVMVDVAGLRGDVGAGDFRFRVGSDDDPAGWDPGPAPQSITVRPGAGMGNSDRITLIWPDGAIQKQWLEVTVLATAHTGLAEADVFYFGNAVGESGNSATDAKVNAFDMLAARNNQRHFLDPAPIDFPFDYNRDRRVNVFDMLIARNNTTHFLNALKLITVPAGKGGVGTESAIPLHSAGNPAASTMKLNTDDYAPRTERHRLYDAVLAQSDPQPSERREPSADKLAWLHEFDQMRTQEQRDREDDSSEAIVDRLLATWGP